SPSEVLVAGIVCQVLGMESISATQDFFDAGGDSILAAQVLSRLAVATGRQLPILGLFEMPTVRALATWLEKQDHPPTSTLVVRRTDSRDLPLSFAQERLWFLAQFEKENAALLRPALFRLKGPLNTDALDQSLSWLVERHEILRTNFHSHDGAPVQQVS